MGILENAKLKLKSKVGSEFDVDKKQAMELLGDDSVRVIDVRTKEEIDKVEPLVEDAIIIDYHSENFKEEIEKLPKDVTYLLVWTGGVRSLGACDMMKKMGFEKIYNLKGGLKEFKDCNEWG